MRRRIVRRRSPALYNASMALIAVTASDDAEAERYVASLTSRGGEARVLTPPKFAGAPEAMAGVSGLLLAGGYDVHPRYYGEEATAEAEAAAYPERDEMELAVIRDALEREMPLLAICRGMQMINVVFGGSLIQDLPGHRAPHGAQGILSHQVYVSPGSKLGAIIGAGAFYKTNSLHHQGLKEAQRAPGLLASSYHPDDGIIEGLESPDHRWLIGVQCHPEREQEVPRSFLKLFDWLVGWAERYEAGNMG